MSRYTTVDRSWRERVRTLRQDLKDEDYARFFFLLCLCLVDAYDENDYDRHEAVKNTLKALKAHDYEGIEKGLDELEEL